MHGLIHHRLHKKKQSAATITRPAGWLLVLEKATIIAGVIGPTMVIPQIFKIYYLHNASGVSALSWFAFGVLDIPFLLYGAAHKDRPIMVTYTLWLIANFIVAAGAMVYR
jgi:uncharacterized protein with PQ loop repeat